MSDKEYPMVRIEGPTTDGDYYMFVIDKGYEYVCICGKPNCRMKKMVSASDYMEKYKIHIDKKDFNFHDHNVYAVYHYSCICKWPIEDKPFSSDIHCVYRRRGITELDDDEGYASIKRGIYLSSFRLLGNILGRITKSDQKIMYLQYQVWRLEKDIYT